jgi:cystathionine gamma-synthase
MSATTTALYPQPGLGVPVPPAVAHAISVSLPTWRDNVGYMEGEKRVVDAMASGYPRFVVHFSVRKVCSESLLYPMYWTDQVSAC